MARDTGLTVRELERRFGSDEYSEWLAYFRLEPSSYHLQRAMLEVLVHLLNAWREKRVAVEDFLPRIERSERALQSPATQLALLGQAFPGYRVADPQ